MVDIPLQTAETCLVTYIDKYNGRQDFIIFMNWIPHAPVFTYSTSYFRKWMTISSKWNVQFKVAIQSRFFNDCYVLFHQSDIRHVGNLLLTNKSSIMNDSLSVGSFILWIEHKKIVPPPLRLMHIHVFVFRLQCNKTIIFQFLLTMKTKTKIRNK